MSTRLETEIGQFGHDTIEHQGKTLNITYWVDGSVSAEGAAPSPQKVFVAVDPGAAPPEQYRIHQFLALAYVAHALQTVPPGTTAEQVLHLVMTNAVAAVEQLTGIKAAVLQLATTPPTAPATTH